jgi:MoaA/NifB/PqqE/SkfB family radical SAM enzyme
MECAVVVTYRCNSRCQMCYAWKNPSRADEEITPQLIDKLPAGHKRLNITGGEPFLRQDIEEIVAVLNKKTTRLEISTNGFFTDRIIDLAKKYPNITIRVSLEGLPKLNDEIRGLKDGFDHGLRTILRLKEIGLKDIGFAIVISQKNIQDLLDLYHLTVLMDLEFANSTLHNSFYFFKNDNRLENLDFLTEEMKKFLRALLSSKRKNIKLRLKDWFRAYLNLGLLNYMRGERRALPCGAATDTYVLDPYGNVLACNGSDEPLAMGNLKDSSFEEIWNGGQASLIRKQVAECQKNCWMVGTAVPAMRKRIWIPISWVLNNKLRLALKKDIEIEKP